MTNNDLRKKIIDSIDSNHIWINALTIINPSDDTYKEIGRTVVHMLNNRENLLPSFYDGEKFKNDELTEIQKLTDCLYLYINAS